MLSNFSGIVLEEKKKENKKQQSGLCSAFVFNHLADNWSLTLGVHLRRVLLDYVGGVALCGVRISDVNGPVKTKFSKLVGLDRAVFFLISKLKEIIFEEDMKRLLTEEVLSFSEIFLFSLKVKSEGEEIVIKAGDFVNLNEKNGIKIRNPELNLAILSPNNYLDVTLYCRKGFGYLEERKQENALLELGDDFVIVLDSNYSPVVNTFPKEEIIVTSLIDKEEKLTLEIETNGSITPRRALGEALIIVSNVWSDIKEKLDLESKKE